VGPPEFTGAAMKALTRHNRAFGVAALGYLALQLAGAGPARYPQQWLQVGLGGAYSPALDGVIVAAGLAFLLGYRRHLLPPHAGQALLLAAAVLGMALAAGTLDIPEERFHLLQFGVLSWLATESLDGLLPPVFRHGFALLFVMVAGVSDEIVQWLLPNRVGDFRDILLDWLGAALAQVALAAILERPCGRGPQAPPPGDPPD
jgi:hypothetical protein